MHRPAAPAPHRPAPAKDTVIAAAQVRNTTVTLLRHTPLHGRTTYRIVIAGDHRDAWDELQGEPLALANFLEAVAALARPDLATLPQPTRPAAPSAVVTPSGLPTTPPPATASANHRPAPAAESRPVPAPEPALPARHGVPVERDLVLA